MMEQEAAAATTYSPRYIDIGINLSDPIFRGVYHGNQRHPDDLSDVIGRARDVGCKKLLVTGSDVKSSRDGLDLARQYPGIIYSTVGIHPCSSSVFGTSYQEHDDGHTMPCDADPTKPMPDHEESCPEKTATLLGQVASVIKTARAGGYDADGAQCCVGLAAFGEFGLDYDRLHYCSKKLQLHSFAAQLKLAASLEPQLPLFLHSRAAHIDFVSLLKAHFGEKLEKLTAGAVVHSFTGTVDEMRELIQLGLFIGVNGCSFKTAENCAVVKELNLESLMLETDGPWCEVRPSHEGWKYLMAAQPPQQPPSAVEAKQGTKKKPAKKELGIPERYQVVKKEKWTQGAMVKGRNEPCMMERIATIVAGIKGVPVEAVCEAAWANTVSVFGLGEDAP